MKDGYFLSVYAHIDPVAAAYAISVRHDQAMALWRWTGSRLGLVRYWEFERLSGVKGHARSFADTSHALAFIDEALAAEGLSLGDIGAIIGTPGLAAPDGPSTPPPTDPAAAHHALCHLYSGLLADSDRFHHGKILCLALDAGPDHVVDPDAWDKPHYLGAFADHGKVSLFPVCSPALLWALLRERCGLAEGTLMALGSATATHPAIPVPPPPPLRSIHDRFAAQGWLDRAAQCVDDLAAHNPGLFVCPHGRFRPEENRVAALVRIVQDASVAMVARNIEQALDRFAADPAELHLSMVGGFALNCPANAALMDRFGFAGFIAPPAVNDSGIALGMGLYHAHRMAGADLTFHLGTAFHGRRHDHPEQVLTASALAPWVAGIDRVTPDQVVDDILAGPVVWFDGAAEIGPRALGHRSLLADPRNLDHKDRLNRIKQREWWRPVAPIVRAERAGDWFALTGPSPFMLRAVAVHPHRRDTIAAICHLDGTARVQTLEDDDDPALAAVLRAFEARTGVPMLANTSLNDKGEPIIDDPVRAVSFALDKAIAVVYLNGLRVRLAATPATTGLERGEVPRPGARHFRAPALTADWLARHNPFGLSRRDLAAYFSDPRLARHDPTQARDAAILRRVLRAAAWRHPGTADIMLAETGTRNGGLEVE